MEVRYFDYNATAPLSDAARSAWLEASEVFWQNPSSPYRGAARVRARLEAAREHLAGLLGVLPERVVFNSGATEGNHAVFAYWRRVLPEGALIGVSPTEHPSVLEVAKRLFADRVVWLELDAVGAVAVDRIPWARVAAVSVMAANNETGILNDWRAIAASAEAAGVLYHCDASQWVGKFPLDGLSACDFVTGCGHKFGGPRGVGFWVLPKGLAEFSELKGGAQERGLRAGTEDVASVLAMVAALESYVVSDFEATGRDWLVGALDDFELIGAGAERLWNTALLVAPRHVSARWIRGLERRGFLVSAGAACATGKAGASAVLAAMGVDVSAMGRTVRISCGPEAGLADWQALVAAVREVQLDLDAEAASGGAQVISI